MRFSKVLTTLLVTTVVTGCVSVPVSERTIDDDIRLELVEWARLAQNAHNMQSWRIVLPNERPQEMVLFVEPTRLLPETDPPSRQVTISMGTFLAVLEARAADLGYTAVIELYPQGIQEDSEVTELPVASIRLTPAPADDPAVARYPVAGDVDALTQPTVKYRFEAVELGVDTISRLEAYSGDGLSVEVISEPATVARLTEISIEAFEIEMEHEPTLMESYNVTRMNGRQRRRQPYGIAYTANFPLRSLWLIDAVSTVAPQRPEAYAEAGIRAFTESMGHVNDYVLIRTTANDRLSQVETGMVLQAVWMDLIRTGHVVLANSQALQEYPEMAELYELIHREFADDGETIQMLLAIARPQGGRHRYSPRLPVEALVAEDVAQ